MAGENQEPVTGEPVEFEKNNLSEFNTLRELPLILQEYTEILRISTKSTKRRRRRKKEKKRKVHNM